MTQETYSENIRKILVNKEKIENKLDIKITNKGKLVFIDGPGEAEYLGIKVIEAIDLGFSVETALSLENEEIILQVLNIKDITKRKDLERVRARLIGTFGKTIKNMNFLTDCKIAVHDNQVGIIGHADDIKEALISIKCIIQGSKQANVYARLEKKKKDKRLNPKTIRKQDLRLDED